MDEMTPCMCVCVCIYIYIYIHEHNYVHEKSQQVECFFFTFVFKEQLYMLASCTYSKIFSDLVDHLACCRLICIQ